MKKNQKWSNIFYSKYFIIPMFFAFIFGSFVITRKVLFSHKLDHSIRSLSNTEKSYIEDLCKKSDRLYNYFYSDGDYDIKPFLFEKLEPGAEILMNMFDSNFDNVKSDLVDYFLAKNGKYVFFLVMFFLLIIVSIFYNCIYCWNKCTLNYCRKADPFHFECCQSDRTKKIICIILPFIYLIIIILAFIVVILISIGSGEAYGIVCTAFQFGETFLTGQKKNVYPLWSGMTGISDSLNEVIGQIFDDKNNTEIVNDVYNNVKEYIKEFYIMLAFMNSTYEKVMYLNDKKELKYMTVKFPKTQLNEPASFYNITPYYMYNYGPYFKPGTILNSITSDDKYESIMYLEDILPLLGCNYIPQNDVYDCDNSSPSSLYIVLNFVLNGLSGVNDTLISYIDRFSKPINEGYNNWDEVIITIIVISIIIIVSYSIIIETILIIIRFCKDKFCRCCFKWVLCVIYYISFALLLLIILGSIIVGMIGKVILDLSNMTAYITSSENLNSNKPKIFPKNDALKFIDVCWNGDGNIMKALGATDKIRALNNLTNHSDTFEYKNSSSPLIDLYLDILEGISYEYSFPNYVILGKNPYTELNLSNSLEEINKYVSGKYKFKVAYNCVCPNEIWSFVEKKEGYIYDKTYPPIDEKKII